MKLLGLSIRLSLDSSAVEFEGSVHKNKENPFSAAILYNTFFFSSSSVLSMNDFCQCSLVLYMMSSFIEKPRIKNSSTSVSIRQLTFLNILTFKHYFILICKLSTAFINNLSIYPCCLFFPSNSLLTFSYTLLTLSTDIEAALEVM
jgi:hypothetical protein